MFRQMRRSCGTDDLKVANSRVTPLRKRSKMQYSTNFFCRVVLFDVFDHHARKWKEGPPDLVLSQFRDFCHFS